MEHVVLPAFGRKVLLVDVTANSDGHGAGYGIMLKRMDRVLWYACVTGSALFYSREATTINRAVFQLETDDLTIIPRRGWRGLWLRLAWLASAPFRIGRPLLWARHALARVVLGRIYPAVEASTRLPAPVRRALLRPRGFYRALKAADRQYADLCAARWDERYRRDAKRAAQAAGKPGQPFARRFRLPAHGERDALARAARVGLDTTRPLVTVHARESGYRAASNLRQRSWDTLRNARIENYLDALGALVERGYTVVRLGDATMTPVAVPGVIDLARSPERSEWLEAWCVQHSTFLIGCDSGPSWLAFLLGVPVLTLNALHFRDVRRRTDRVICKRVRDRATGHTLSIQEMLTPDYLRHGLDTERYEHVDNSSEDIRAAVLDMLEVVATDTPLSPAQRRINQRMTELVHAMARPRKWTGLEGIAVAGRPRGALSRPFAEKYLE